MLAGICVSDELVFLSSCISRTFYCGSAVVKEHFIKLWLLVFDGKGNAKDLKGGINIR